MAQEKKAAPDWERIEADYRAGLLSVREIAAAHGITHGAINKRKIRDGWERDLTARIQAKADALVSKREVSTAVSAERVATDRLIVEANAEAIARVRLAHRADIARSRALAMSLLGELEQQTADPNLFESLGELVLETGPEAESKLLEAYRRVLSTPGRIEGMKKLADTLKTLIGLEREAYGLTDQQKLELVGKNGERLSATLTTDPIEAARVYQKIMSGNV